MKGNALITDPLYLHLIPAWLTHELTSPWRAGPQQSPCDKGENNGAKPKEPRLGWPGAAGWTQILPLFSGLLAADQCTYFSWIFSFLWETQKFSFWSEPSREKFFATTKTLCLVWGNMHLEIGVLAWDLHSGNSSVNGSIMMAPTCQCCPCIFHLGTSEVLPDTPSWHPCLPGTPSGQLKCGWMNTSNTTMLPGLLPWRDLLESKCHAG